MANSTGRRAPIDSMPRLMPATNAATVSYVLPSISAGSRAAIRSMPTVRWAASEATKDGPRISA
jgi:hypothetical protein